MPRHCEPNSVVVVEGGGEAAGGVADLLFGFDGAVGVEEEDVDGAAVGAAVVVVEGADGDVVDAVAVEVANAATAHRTGRCRRGWR